MTCCQMPCIPLKRLEQQFFEDFQPAGNGAQLFTGGEVDITDALFGLVHKAVIGVFHFFELQLGFVGQILQRLLQLLQVQLVGVQGGLQAVFDAGLVLVKLVKALNHAFGFQSQIVELLIKGL